MKKQNSERRQVMPQDLESASVCSPHSGSSKSSFGIPKSKNTIESDIRVTSRIASEER